MGLGTERDYLKAYETYKKYEEAPHYYRDGVAWARLKIALLYLKEDYTDENGRDATFWFNKAAEM